MKSRRGMARLLLALVVPLLVLASSLGVGNAHGAAPHAVTFVSTSWKGMTIHLVGSKGVARLGLNTDVLINCAYYISTGSAARGQHTIYMRGTVPLFANAPTSFILSARTGNSTVLWDPYGTLGPGPCGTNTNGYIHTGVAVVVP